MEAVNTFATNEALEVLGGLGGSEAEADEQENCLDLHVGVQVELMLEQTPP